MSPIDLTGKVFGFLTVLYKAGTNRAGNITWLCSCACGREKVFSSDHLTRKKFSVKSCGCNRIQRKSNHAQWNGCGDISGNWWYSHVLRERKQQDRTKVPVTVSIEYAWSLFLAQSKRCALSGTLLTISNDHKINNASIDRIDNSKGYEIGNIQWVTKEINFMKGKLSQEYFVQLCKQVAALNV